MKPFGDIELDHHWLSHYVSQSRLILNRVLHYGDVIMGAIASQITSLTIVYSTVYSDADQRKPQSSASLAFVWGIHREPVNSPHKWQVTRKMFSFDDVIMWDWLETNFTGHTRKYWFVKWFWKYICKYLFLILQGRRVNTSEITVKYKREIHHSLNQRKHIKARIMCTSNGLYCILRHLRDAFAKQISNFDT